MCFIFIKRRTLSGVEVGVGAKEGIFDPPQCTYGG
jgi:hypothetical protein